VSSAGASNDLKTSLVTKKTLMKIAIVGAGISGLATAHMLPEHATHHVDTGFIVFNDRNYPNFERVLNSLRVASQPSDMASACPTAATSSTTGPRRMGCSPNART
jgi:predicted NAD/FAD-binding protein